MQPTLGFQRVLQRAVFHVQSSGRKEVTPANVLVAIFGEKQSQAVYLLDLQDVNRLDVVNFVSHGVPKIQEPRKPEGEDGDAEGARRRWRTRSSASPRISTRSREAGKIDPLIGRQAEIERTVQILCRRRKNNPLFVGEAGVGKTALAEGLGAIDRRGQGARRAAQLHDLRARHGLVDRRHEVSRRFREALEGRGRRAEEAARCDSVHRRDPHRDRRGRRVGRRDGRVEPDQAGARERRAALHRLDYL